MIADPSRCSYISPSLLPSRTANSVHVVHQCAALAEQGVHVDLYARRAFADEAHTRGEIQKTYGTGLDSIRLRTYYSGSLSMATSVGIAVLAILGVRRDSGHFILSRNLYAAYLFGVLRGYRILYETHQIELGARAALQKALLASPNVATILISEKLRALLEEAHGMRLHSCTVLHDAAPRAPQALDDHSRRHLLSSLHASFDEMRWRAVCGYFGHLYPGRGIEIIEAMAAARPDVLFLIVGGNDADIAARRAAGLLPNVLYLGHRPHPEALQLMALPDVLLMPYQRSVSIGLNGHDTARWMSPMKMFEYMASGRPIISSDHEVLREVLSAGENALLVPAADTRRWLDALDALLADKALSCRIAQAARLQYETRYTWAARARTIVAIARQL